MRDDVLLNEIVCLILENHLNDFSNFTQAAIKTQ